MTTNTTPEPTVNASGADEVSENDPRVRYPARITSELGDRFRLAAALLGVRANTLYVRAIWEFLEEKPWLKDIDFPWLVPGAAPPDKYRKEGPHNYVQVGLFIPQSLIKRADAVEGYNRRVTRAMVFFTAAHVYANKQKFPETRRMLELLTAAESKDPA